MDRIKEHDGEHMEEIKVQAREVKKLINKIHLNLSDTTEFIPYENMSATLADAVLQAGMNYESVVLPRIRRILDCYADCRTTGDLVALLQTISAEDFLQCCNKRKQSVLCDLARTLHDAEIETEKDLAVWLSDDVNAKSLLKITGIGNKTVDYLKKLCGLQAVPIDRHMFHFLAMAGIKTEDYDEARSILRETAFELGIGESILDTAIWNYMSNLHNEKDT